MHLNGIVFQRKTAVLNMLLACYRLAIKSYESSFHFYNLYTCIYRRFNFSEIKDAIHRRHLRYVFSQLSIAVTVNK